MPGAKMYQPRREGKRRSMFDAISNVNSVKHAFLLHDAPGRTD